MPHKDLIKRREWHINYKPIYRKRFTDEEWKDKSRSWNLKTKYGISLDTYKQMLEDQNFVCALCLEKETEAGRILSVDHDHSTGKVRGLLCGKCNRILAKDLDFFKRVVKYLEIDKHGKIVYN